MVQAGFREHELFVADHGCNFSAIDLRNGRTIYSYKKLAGAVTSVAPSPSPLLASTAQDRFFRLHSTFPPPATSGQQQEQHGEVIGSLYMKSIPTAVVWDPRSTAVGDHRGASVDDEDEAAGEDDEHLWTGMQNVDDSGDDADEGGPKRPRKGRKGY